MAVRFVAEHPWNDETRLFPVAPDLASVFAGRRVEALPKVSVVVSVRNAVPLLKDMLASLSGQTIAGDLELIIVNNRSYPGLRPLIEAAAAGLFAGRVRLVDYDRPFNHSAQTNLGVAAASGEIVCLIDSDVVLHDPRAVASLAAMAAVEEVASAGCLLLDSRPDKEDALKFRSAGVFPAGIAFGGRPRIAYAEPDCGAAFGAATYPVAANSFALAAVRKDVWDRLGGLDAERMATDFNDVDFCLRAMAHGYVSLCTTAVSAYHLGRATRGAGFDVLAADRLAAPDIAALLAKCTVLRRIA
jgi:GT2 family glycosyltransferase